MMRFHMTLKIMAEQNVDLSEEVETLKKDMNGACEQLADIFESGMAAMKEDTDNKCKIMADTILKLHKKMSKLDPKASVKPSLKSKQKTSTDVNSKAKTNSGAKKVPSTANKPTKSYAEAAARAASSVPSASKTSESTSFCSASFSRPAFTKTTPSEQVPPKKIARGNPVTKSSFNSRPKILYAADSVGRTASLKNLENLTNSRIRTAHAYSSVHDFNAKWPEQNFTDVVNYALKNPGLENYDVLVLSAPTVDITNMDTSKLSPLDNTEIYQQNVIISTQNMFSLAQAALEQNRNLKSVVLMEHTPRFDGLDVDPTSLKPNLVKLANSTLNQLWLNSHLKNKISIGHHSLENSGTETAHLARYQNLRTGRYDGVHLYGQTGCRDYTGSVENILLVALQSLSSTQDTAECGNTQKDNHTRCPQAQHQNKTVFHPSVQTQNRFGVFNSKNC